MKKYISVIYIVFTIIILVGCSSYGKINNDKMKKISIQNKKIEQ